MIVSADEIVHCHNEKVESLRKDILELDGDTEGSLKRWRLVQLDSFYGSAIVGIV